MNNKMIFDIEEITQYYRILGLPFTATKDEIRKSRNKLLMRFHPDRSNKSWVDDALSSEERVVLVQSAYLFLIEHYEQILKQFQFLETDMLSSQVSPQIKSHWVYSEISKLKA